MGDVVEFGDAVVGDETYTWQFKEGGLGDYLFETAGDPREFYEEADDAPVIRKRWRLVEIVELEPKPRPEEEE